MTRKIKIGNVYIGGDAPVTVQSMCNTNTNDIEKTVAQIISLENLGCDIIRVAVNNEQSAKAITNIKKEINIPIVADIQYDWKLAKLSAEYGADKVRINPGNIGNDDNVRYLADLFNERNIAVRIGVNEGSLDKSLKGLDPADALVKSAEKELLILEKAGFYNTVVSMKSSNVTTTVKAAVAFHMNFDYPQHIGITEAGTLTRGLVKGSAGIGTLLMSGIGATIRMSLAGNPENEVIAGNMLLTALNLKKGSEVIACPTCARTTIAVEKIANEVEKLVFPSDGIKVAVMGCVVNGIGEAGNADFGVAGGKGKSAIFEKGKIIKTVNNDDILNELKILINKYKVVK